MRAGKSAGGRPVSRRELAGLTARTAIAAPLLLTGFPLRGPSAPSNRIGLGFIGVGWKGFEGCWGSLLQSFIRIESCRVLAVCDVDRRYRDRARAYVDETYGRRGCFSTADFREVLGRPGIDAVVIATPDHWHAVMTVWACRAGMDVYCEKPLSLTVREGRAMVEAARRYARVVQVGSQSRTNSRIRYGCELVRTGRIGKVREIRATCGPPPAPCLLPAEDTPDTLNWDLWLGPAANRPYNSRIHPMWFRAFEEYSGGGITDWGAHHFDLAQWALGMDHSGPVLLEPPSSGEPVGLRLRYANGTTLVHSSFDVEQGVTFVGTEGTVNLMAISGRAAFEPAHLGAGLRDPVVQGADLLGNAGHYEHFLECVRTRRTSAADVEIGHRTATVCHLANIAYRLRRPLRWDPVRETFVGDLEANRYLDRHRRAPWCL